MTSLKYCFNCNKLTNFTTASLCMEHLNTCVLCSSECVKQHMNWHEKQKELKKTQKETKRKKMKITYITATILIIFLILWSIYWG